MTAGPAAISNGSTELWSAATQEQTGAALAAQGSARVSALDFEPGAGLLATVGGDGTARSWDVAFPAGLLAGACAIADQSLTRQQWASYAGTQPFQRVCPAS